MNEHQYNDDDNSSREGSATPENGGKGSSQVRKAQNRIAQREFRQRKQQYIRDLEARVEVLSGDREERVDLMTLLVKNLLKENKELRDMVKSMSTFIGEGLGSCLPRLGLSAPQLEAILNRADTDTAYEAFVNLKASKEMEAANPGLQSALDRKVSASRAAAGKRKRNSVGGERESESVIPSIENPNTLDKRVRPDQMASPNTSMSNDYAYLFPDLASFSSTAPPTSFGQNFNPVLSSSAGYPSNNFLPPQQVPSANNQDANPVFQGVGTSVQNNFSGFGLTLPPTSMFANNAVSPTLKPANSGSDQSTSASAGPSRPLVPSTPSLTLQPPGNTASTTDSSSAEAERQRDLRAAVASLTQSETQIAEGTGMSPADVKERSKAEEVLKQALEGNDRKTEAMQLITYHLNNFRVNHAYHLPLSLRPTPVQRTIPHEHAIDGIVFPSIRDRMILLRGRYDLVDAFHGVITDFEVHGDDVLDHRSWEISEKWLLDYRILVDEDVYNITNTWRVKRGDPPLVRPDKKTLFGGATLGTDGP